MIPVTDKRPATAEHELKTLALGQPFLWEDYLCIVCRSDSINADIDPLNILCMVLRSGELFELNKNAPVVKVECEIDIVE